MGIKIAIVGAPSSGKTVFCSRLYAECLEIGLYKARLVPEYAHEFIAHRGTIANIQDQMLIADEQIRRETHACIDCCFNPVICDGPVWISNVYVDYNIHINNNEYFTTIDDQQKLIDKVSTYGAYDILIYMPLFDTMDRDNEFRMQTNNQAMIIDNIIKKHIEFHVPETCVLIEGTRDLSTRLFLAKYIAQKVKESV